MKKYRVVFDIDDTLNNLVETTYKRLNILSKMPLKKRYYLKDCPELTESEKVAIEQAWNDPETYLACEAQAGIEKVDVISSKENVEVIIHSFCTSHPTADAKFAWLHTFVDCFNIMPKLEVGRKTPIDDVDFVVEDNIEYLCKCHAKHRILINRVHNQAENYHELDLSGIIRVDSLDEALDYILNVMEAEGSEQNTSSTEGFIRV